MTTKEGEEEMKLKVRSTKRISKNKFRGIDNKRTRITKKMKR